MVEPLPLLQDALLAGVGATAFMDLWAALRSRLSGVRGPDYALVGRWIGGMPQGRFRYPAIATAPRVRGEAALGWLAHYAVGVVFAMLLLGLCGPQPGLLAALAFGAASTAAPFLLMQPAFGMGVAASRTPQPARARLRSLGNHLVFGLGLYLAAQGNSLLRG